MTLYRGEALEKIYRGIADDFIDGVCSADGNGGGTTFVDTNLLSGSVGAVPVSGALKRRVVFISSSTDGLAPQSQYRVILDNVNSTGTVTVASAFTAQVNTSDQYGICKATIPIYTLEKLFNDALEKHFTVPVVDVSLTTTAAQTSYTIPIAAKGRQPLGVYIRNTVDSVNYDSPVHGWSIRPATAGSTETLIFEGFPPAGKVIVYVYLGTHPKLTAYNSPVSEYLNPDLAVSAGVERAYWWKMRKGKNKKVDVQNYLDSKRELEQMMMRHRVQIPEVQQYLAIGNMGSYASVDTYRRTTL